MDTHVELRCGFCEQRNRVDIDKALGDLSSVVCGRCSLRLLRVRGEPLLHLKAEDLMHPWDKEAISKLQSLPYAEDVLKKLMGSTYDKLSAFQLESGSVRVGGNQLPSLYRLYLEAAGRLDVEPPPLYVTQSKEVNAMTIGVREPVVVVTTGLLDLLDDSSLVGVLGHELTHVKLGHVSLRTLAFLLARGTLSALNFVGLAKLAFKPLQVLLTRWVQMSELSADRGELVATGSLETHVRTHLLLSGGSQKYASELSVEAFVDQANRAEALRDSDLLLTLNELWQDKDRSHPMTVWRVHHAMRWARTQTFFDVLSDKAEKRLALD